MLTAPETNEIARPTAPQAPSLEEAVARARRAFPLPAYMHEGMARLQYPLVFDVVRRHLRPGDAVLDFGSGPCDIAAILSLLGYRLTACDDLSDSWHLQPGMRDAIQQFARDMGVTFKLLDSSHTLPGAPESFDMVMLHHVLEHLVESPRELMNALVRLIKPGGVLFVTVPNAGNLRKRLALLLGGTNMPGFADFYWDAPVWRGHRREYVRSDLAQLATFLGLETLELHGYHYMLMKFSPGKRLLFRAISAVVPGLRDSWLLVARKPTSWQPMRRTPTEVVERLRFKPGSL